MSQLTPPGQAPHNADPSAPAVEPGFEVVLHAFWEKNRNLIQMTCLVILLGIIAWQGWGYFSAWREAGVKTEYARISDQPAKLAAFAASNSGHALAGVALLQLADDKFASGDYAAAATHYQKAADSLKNEALLGRAKLGAAISRISGSDRAGGEAALKVLSADASLLKGARAEAAYHLAALAAEAGNADEVRKQVEQVSRIDATSSWSQRATMLLASLPPGSKPAESTAPSVSFKPGK